MANEQNLRIPSSEEARKIGRKGGIASGETRRKKKLMREQMELLLSLPYKDTKKKKEMKKLGFETEDIDNQMAVVFGVWEKALQGDVKAAEFLRNTLGEAPAEKLEVNASISDKVKEIENYLNEK